MILVCTGLNLAVQHHETTPNRQPPAGPAPCQHAACQAGRAGDRISRSWRRLGARLAYLTPHTADRPLWVVASSFEAYDFAERAAVTRSGDQLPGFSTIRPSPGATS